MRKNTPPEPRPMGSTKPKLFPVPAQSKELKNSVTRWNASHVRGTASGSPYLSS